MRRKSSWLLCLAVTLLFTTSAGAGVVINEILANPGSQYDGAEYIELFNDSATSTNVGGWVIGGTEYSGTCGEDLWQIPSVPAAIIAAGGYLIIAKDNTDSDPNLDDGFKQRYGYDADFEFYDADRTDYEYDDPAVDNMVQISALDPLHDDQVGFIPDNGYGASCGSYNMYEALFLWDNDPTTTGVLIDAIEYSFPDSCAGDVCLGVGASDNDRFLGVPGVGEVLCRDASGTDTDNSSADLFLGTCTPKAANLANAGPELSDLVIDNPDPRSGETVSVTITATDADGLGTLYVVYDPHDAAMDSVSMSWSGTDQYTGTIPAQSDTANVRYFVRGYDAGTAAGVGHSKYPDYGVRQVRWGTQSIVDVQQHSPVSDTGYSDEVGRAVNVEGIVTCEPGLYSPNTFVIQSAPGFWNGVLCYDYLAQTVVERGDSVRVSGVVGEYYNLTQIQLFGGENVQVLSSGHALPGPQAVTPAMIATGTQQGEALEGVYARLTDVAVTLDDDGNGQWVVDGVAIIGDYAYYNYNPTIGDTLDVIDGIVNYTYSERKLEPRDDGDIQGPPIVTTVRYSPLPPTAASQVTFTAEITDNGSITRAKLFYSFDNGATVDSTDMSNTGGDTYAVALGPYSNGTEIDYHIEVTDNDGFNGRAPAQYDYDLYVGLRTIEAVQSTFASGTTDSSAFAGMPTNVAGYVTVAPGMIADNIFYIQNQWVTDPSYRGIPVFSGGSLVGQVAIGDSVAVCGDVVEYFNFTQIRMHYTDAYHVYGNLGSELPAYELPTSSLLPDSTGAVPATEPWEGVFVMCKNAIVTNSSLGYGEWFIDNTEPKTGEETLVDDLSYYVFEPTLGESLSVQGVIDYAYGQYRLQPRLDGDILPYDPAAAVGVDVGQGGPVSFALHQNSPNPFRGVGTRISFALPTAANAQLRVFDIQGRLVKTLVDGRVEAGRHNVDWNGRNSLNRPVSSGVYFYRLTAGAEEATRKMIVLQ